MYCKICGEKGDGFRIFGLYMCKECFEEISLISVFDDRYDRYKNLVRILLGYYIGDIQRLSPNL